ncbi:MAG TPA: hypothetical protein VFT49_00590 [Candidatus Saccharimonadales bacterium]|nr:hypothetical protein [Candidatus Saccharimonadales bacterium]
MPTVNIYQKNSEFEYKLATMTKSVKGLIAKELSGKDIVLSEDEVSVRLLKAAGDGMLAPVEVEINAAAFEERVKKQDEICLKIQEFLKDALQSDIKVWLILSELGHSWK